MMCVEKISVAMHVFIFFLGGGGGGVGVEQIDQRGLAVRGLEHNIYYFYVLII